MSDKKRDSGSSKPSKGRKGEAIKGRRVPPPPPKDKSPKPSDGKKGN